MVSVSQQVEYLSGSIKSTQQPSFVCKFVEDGKPRRHFLASKRLPEVSAWTRAADFTFPSLDVFC